jgi:hypothetical protein
MYLKMIYSKALISLYLIRFFKKTRNLEWSIAKL